MNIHKNKKIKKEREEAITLAHEKGDEILMRKLEKERDDAELEVTFWLLSLSFIDTPRRQLNVLAMLSESSFWLSVSNTSSCYN